MTAGAVAALEEDPRVQLWPWIEWLTVEEIGRLVWLRWLIGKRYVHATVRRIRAIS